MVRPTKPKEMKPKADATGSVVKDLTSGLEGNKLIIVNVITTLAICILFIGTNYVMQDSLLSSKLKHIGSEETEEEVDEHVEEAGHERGIILDLGEFVLNLSDIKSRRYLKVNVALELTKSPSDPDLHAPAPSGGGHGGHGAAAPDPMEVIEKEMSQFKPAIRDSIISILSSKTSEELLSIPGKELSKEQIKEAVDALFNEEREVIRVSFGNFIIQ